MQVVLTSCGSWYLPNTAKALETREALAGLWVSERNRTSVLPAKYHRCWPFHLAMKPFYQFMPQIWVERAFYGFFPIWRAWIKRQPWPPADVVQAIMGYATEPFDRAERSGALKVIDCANSHPVTQYGYWQRECDLWCPGEKVAIPRWMFGRMTRELERADVILCPSTFVRDSMVANGLDAGKCFVSPFGVDPAVFKPRPRVPDRPRFVSVGTICVRKGHQYLFRAFDELRRAVPEAELICVGSYKVDFRRERPKWEGRFTHIPALSHAGLNELFSTCTAFVFPSCEEGFARVLAEALGAGLPLIATHESGATTVVTDGVEGFIVPARQPAAIARAMQRLATGRELCGTMGAAAHARSAAGNSWQDYGDRLLNEYQGRLEARKRAG